ncbi:MAG: hypothetical protein K8R77_01485 [Anaerolineaceae bacterium]|nr:hypothetical protein [Anaerolineaceae bacterium]
MGGVNFGTNLFVVIAKSLAIEAIPFCVLEIEWRTGARELFLLYSRKDIENYSVICSINRDFLDGTC